MQKYFNCCHGCVPPKRHPGCHSTCPDGIADKQAWEEERKKISAERHKEADYLGYRHESRDRRRRRNSEKVT